MNKAIAAIFMLFIVVAVLWLALEFVYDILNTMCVMNILGINFVVMC